MSSFGELVLIVGDHHIPKRANAIPEQFKRMLVPNKMQHVICTGNIGSRDQCDELLHLAPNVHIVSGDYDEKMSFPSTRVIQVGEFRIGLIHGHQIIPWGNRSALAGMRRKLGVDILISGHTHQNEVVEHDGFHHINPGSITGAFSPLLNTAIPSFILLAIQGCTVVCYVYELIDGEVEVSKTEFTKAANEPM